MQDWIFDRDSARSTPAVSESLTAVPPASVPVEDRQAGGRRRWTRYVAAGSAVAVVIGGAAVAAAGDDSASRLTAAAVQERQTQLDNEEQRSAPTDPTDPWEQPPGTSGTVPDDETAPPGEPRGLPPSGSRQELGPEGTTSPVQFGIVTEASEASVTIQTRDGQTATYAIDEDTRIETRSGNVVVGEPVLIEVADQNTETAAVISSLRGPGGRGGQMPFEPQQQAPEAPTTTTST